ncbi:hypothetical protein SDC9_147421 [bioreactor metagenome]|uniref:Uncharacterized protein n=1 Tax=bioreactor metagenome TaxID=1076179 RepID=A0A645EEM7_9ZZZZ
MASTRIQGRFEYQFRLVLTDMHMTVDLIDQGMQANVAIHQSNQNVFTQLNIEVIAIVT